jgi:hypothetical protein
MSIPRVALNFEKGEFTRPEWRRYPARSNGTAKFPTSPLSTKHSQCLSFHVFSGKIHCVEKGKFDGW